MDTSYQYTKVRENIWQIREDDGVCCTLIRGRDLAVLVDTGYGVRDLRAFVEANVSTPYIVINSHGHPDHIAGNHWFDCAYIAEADLDVLRHFDEGQRKTCPLKTIAVGNLISLGDYHVEVVSLAGHTKGSVGLLIREERLLLAGDALNDWLWLFNFGALSMEDLYMTLQRTLELDFDTYLGGHSDREYTKDLIRAHIRNIEHLDLSACEAGETLGFHTYTSTYNTDSASSVITFTVDKLPQ